MLYDLEKIKSALDYGLKSNRIKNVSMHGVIITEQKKNLCVAIWCDIGTEGVPKYVLEITIDDGGENSEQFDLESENVECPKITDLPDITFSPQGLVMAIEAADEDRPYHAEEVINRCIEAEVAPQALVDFYYRRRSMDGFAKLTIGKNSYLFPIMVEQAQWIFAS